MKFEITIFIASPSDVTTERNIVEEVSDTLEAEYNNISIKPVRWENYPQSYQKDAQSNINHYLQPSQCDIVIVIFWHRFGTYLPKNYVGPITKDCPVTGTQWEFEEALASGKPAIHFYLKKADLELLKDKELQKQYFLLQNFLQKIGLYHGNAHHGFHEFTIPTEFKQRLYNHLKLEIERIVKQKRAAYYKKLILLPFLLLAIVAAIYLYNGDKKSYFRSNDSSKESRDVIKEKNSLDSLLLIKKENNTSNAVKINSHKPKMEFIKTTSQKETKREPNSVKDKNNTTKSSSTIKDTSQAKQYKREKKISQKEIKKKLHTFLENWLWAFNNANILALESMYAKEFVLNGTFLKRKNFIRNTKKFFERHRLPKRYHMGLDNIAIKQLNTNIYKISYSTYIKNFPRSKQKESLGFLIIDTSKAILQIIEQGINMPKELKNGQIRPYTITHLEGLHPKIYKNFQLHAIFRDSRTYHLGDEEIKGWEPLGEGGNCFNIPFEDDGKFGGYVLNFSSYGADAIRILLNDKQIGKPMHQEKIDFPNSNFWTNRWVISFDNQIKNRKNIISICSARVKENDCDDFMIKKITLYRWKP